MVLFHLLQLKYFCCFSEKLLIFSFKCDIIPRSTVLSTFQLNTERYRSGHNGADSKSVCAKAHEGSNPSLSAIKQEASSLRMLLVLCENTKRDSNAVKKQPKWLFLNGDRRFLPDITKNKSETSGKNQERIPLVILTY